MKVTLYFVAWWEYDQPDSLLAGPFVSEALARDAAREMRVFEGKTHAVAISAGVELADIEALP